MESQVASAEKLEFSNPVKKIVDIASKRWFGLMKAYEDPQVMNQPAVLAKLQWESQVVNSITQAANNVVKDLTEPLKSIVQR